MYEEMKNCKLLYSRWLLVRDTFVAYMDHRTEQIRLVLLMDKDFKVGELRIGWFGVIIVYVIASCYRFFVPDVFTVLVVGVCWLRKSLIVLSQSPFSLSFLLPYRSYVPSLANSDERTGLGSEKVYNGFCQPVSGIPRLRERN